MNITPCAPLHHFRSDSRARSPANTWVHLQVLCSPAVCMHIRKTPCQLSKGFVGCAEELLISLQLLFAAQRWTLSAKHRRTIGGHPRDLRSRPARSRAKKQPTGASRADYLALVAPSEENRRPITQPCYPPSTRRAARVHWPREDVCFYLRRCQHLKVFWLLIVWSVLQFIFFCRTSWLCFLLLQFCSVVFSLLRWLSVRAAHNFLEVSCLVHWLHRP